MTAAATPMPPATPARRALLGLGAVLFGAFISTLTGRLSTLGLADIRGALGLGFDEAAWITTTQAVAQMVIAPIAVWSSSVLGPRRVLLAGCVAFAVASTLTPFAGGIRSLLVLQFIAGLGSGCFMPLTILVVLRSLPPLYWPVGIVLYAMNIEASLNISASLEGFYVDHLSWAWIFWQNVPMAVCMALCVHFGLPRVPVDRAAGRKADWFGMLSISLGLSMVYAALDQGNRLDWLQSDLVVALLGAGIALLVVFVVHELTSATPWVDLRLVLGGYLPILLLFVCEVRFAGLSTAFLIPQFLGSVRGFRAPEIGDVLIWIAIPQLIAAPMAVGLMRLFDPRLMAFAGIAMIGAACWITATHLTAQWSKTDFLGTQLLQAMGQTFAISGSIFIGVLNIRPPAIPTFGVMLQIARLMGGEIGLAFIVTFVRRTEQTASNLFGTHVQSGTLEATARLHSMAAGIASRSDSATTAGARALGMLAQSVRAQANLEACVQGFALIAISSLAAFVLLLAFDRPPKGPASPTFDLWPLRRKA
jgi:DHA2 family multidrug resistance protein